ncbi:hypothetical protein ACSS6W_008304 [Trichoderma asperelloides]
MTDLREMKDIVAGNNATFIQGDLHATSGNDGDRKFLEKISKTDPFYDWKRILDLKGPFLHGSFEWILNHDDFQKWRNTKESGALWIKGDPGKGKTMLLCGIIDDLGKNPEINSNFCYFFFQATDNRINSAVAAVGGLIFSLLKPRQELLSAFRKKFEDTISQLSGPNAWQVLCDIFETVTQDQALPNVVCVVDALDECEHDVKSLLRLIVKTSGHVKWLLSSRNVKEIERNLRSIDDSQRLILELQGNAEYVSRSVDAYIDDSIRDITALTDDEELRIKTMETLRFKADGTFLWVSLVVEQLRETDRRNIEEVLEGLPVGLENLYDLILKRITKKSKKDQNICQILLSIVTTAERPLRLEELLEFIKFQWKDYKAKYAVRDMRDIVKDCGSFLSIKGDTIYFVHQSVKDYMVGKGAKSIFPLGVAYQHSEMFKSTFCAMSCILTYDIYNLKAPNTESFTIVKPYPDPLAPLAYCCIFWVDHLVQSCQLEKSNVDEYLKENGILHQFLKDKFLCWLESLIFFEAVDQGLSALNKLKSITARRCEYKGNQYLICDTTHAYKGKRDNSLEQFIDDAWQFIHDCKEYVCNFPLQLYYAAFVFGDNDNMINKTFQQAIHAKFRYLPIFTNKPRRRYYRLQVIKPKRRFTSLHFSPDSSLLCLLHNDNLSFWRPKSGMREFEFQLNLNEEGMEKDSEPDTSHHIAFSSDSSQLISVLSKGVVQRWSINNGIQIEQYRLKFVEGTERVIALSRNGDLAASVTAGDIGQLNIWTTKTGAQKQTIRLGNKQKIFGAAFSSDPELVALIDEAGVAIYSVQTGKDIKHLQWPPHRQASNWDHLEYKTQSQFSPNSEAFAYVYDERNIEIWCTKTWTIKQRITLRNVSYDLNINQFAFSPDSATFLIGTARYLLFGSTATGQFQQHIFIRYASTCIFSPSWNGKKSSWLLATGDNGRDVTIWRVNTTETLIEAHNPLFSTSVEHISSDAKLVAAMDHQGCDINIIAAESGKVVQVIERGNSKRSKPCFSTNSDLAACKVGDKANVQIWDVNTGRVMQVLQGPGYGRGVTVTVAFSYDSKYLVAGYRSLGHNSHVRIWCVKSGENLYKLDSDEFPFTFQAVAISLGSKFVALSNPHEVQIWEPRTGHCAHRFKGPVEDIAFSADSICFAVINESESGRRKVEIWEVATGTSLICVKAEDSDSALSFDPVTGDVLTDRFIYKNSSWEHWDKVPRQDYPLWRMRMDWGRNWICRSGEGIIYIPNEFSGVHIRFLTLSDFLLKYGGPGRRRVRFKHN